MMGALSGPSEPLLANIVHLYLMCELSPVTVPCVEVPVMLAWVCV